MKISNHQQIHSTPKQHSAVRRLFAILLLLTGLLPVQQVFACEIMGGPAKTTCCCDDSLVNNDCAKESCDQDGQISLAKNGCCDVSLDEPAVYTGQQNTVHAIGILEEIDPPQLSLLNALSDFQSEQPFFTDSAPSADHPLQLTNQTYLLTRRLRI